MSDIINRLPQVRGKYRQNANLAKMCWFQVGGSIDVLYQPADLEDLSFFMANLPADISYFVFGVGSNMLIRDGGFKGVAIRLGREFNYLNINDREITAGAAVLDLNFALLCCEAGLKGLEFLSGVPGTIGGALAMNAGAYGREIKDVLLSAKAVGRSGEVRTFAAQEIGYKYRGKALDESWIFVEGLFKGEEGDKQEIKSKIDDIQQQRQSTQPVKTRTGGSTFKNPDHISAWKLIDEAGCRGLKIGGAQVSEMHCNFIINNGDATALDLENLIKEIKTRVYAKSNVMLEEEIKIIGDVL
jgi:UDP-N-acetylmuramate dehydrogenase